MSRFRDTTRKLLKFSHYSTAVVLPKTATNRLGWQPSDAVVLEIHEADQTIVIKKLPTNQKSINLKATDHIQTTADDFEPKYSVKSKLINNQQQKVQTTIVNEFIPIPEIVE